MNTNVNEKNIFRLAALVYSNAIGAKHTNDTLLAIVESAFIDAHNQPMQVNQLISKILTDYSVIITEEELNGIVDNNSAVFCVEKIEGIEYISIDDALLVELQEKTSKSVDLYIDMYIKESGCSDSAKEAIYRFLYNLTMTNITSYQKMIGTGTEVNIHSDSLISIDPSAFQSDERRVISGFLEWNNPEKDTAITNIILCCLEYCLVVNGDKANELTKKHLKKRCIYLDTNIIFRALGINGSHRKDVILAFLSKCKQAGMRLFVTSYTLREFYDTMKYYVKQAQTMPADNIYDGAYEDLCDYNVFSYYHEWKRDHIAVPQGMFWSYLDSAIQGLITEYSIEEDKTNIFAPAAQKKIDEYDRGICQIKDATPNYVRQFYGANKHDAILVYIAEAKRAELHDADNHADCLIATSDKELRYWDYKRTKSGTPLVVYPSQLFALLIKLCGRSTNDMKSFVSFINIKPAIKQISVSKAHAILAAIGTLTNDFKTQKLLVSSVFDDAFQKIIISAKDEAELFEMSKVHGQKLIDERFEQQEAQLTETQRQVSTLQNQLAEEVELRNHERTERNKEQLAASKHSDRQADLIEKLAFKHTGFIYHLVWTVLPILALLVGFIILVLFLIGVFGKAEKNITLQLIEWFRTTPVGEKMSDVYEWLAALAITAIGCTFGYGSRMLLSSKRKNKRTEYKNKYLEKMQA